MEAQAFVESDLNTLIDCALTFIPRDSTIARLIHDVRDWHAEYPDWRQARQQIEAHYGYDKFGGNCHMVPNHALIHLGLLYGIRRMWGVCWASKTAWPHLNLAQICVAPWRIASTCPQRMGGAPSPMR
ncbi:MAG: hypothetical protein RL076_2789 [Chloroflexota bacterium]